MTSTKAHSNGTTKRLTRSQIDAALAEADDTGKAETTPKQVKLVVSAPNFQTYTFSCKGLTPYMQNAWSAKAIKQMLDAMARGDGEGDVKVKRPPKDFAAAYKGAFHRSTDGWVGIPCSAIRAALIAACRAANLHMTQMKQAIVDVEPDGFDAITGQGLIRLIAKKQPECNQLPVRLKNGGTDIHPRPLWRNWAFEVRITVDEDMVNRVNLVNLLVRAGRQVGIGEGRPMSPKSHGLGFGVFVLSHT